MDGVTKTIIYINDRHNVCETRAAVLSILSHELWDTWREEYRVETFGLLVSSAFPVSLLKVFPGLNSVREVVYFGGFWWRQDLSAVIQTSSSCPMGHTAQLVFAIGPNLIPIQLHELLQGLLLQS